MTAARSAAVVAALVLGATLAGCGGSSAGTSVAPAAAAAPADAAAAAAQDERFANAMIEHRHTALKLVGLAAPHAQDPDVLTWAGRLQMDQEGQLRRLVDLVESWGGTPAHVEGHVELGDSVPGVLDEAAFAELVGTPPPRFEARLLDVVLAHLETAVPLARAELASGGDPTARQFAQQVLDDVEAQRKAVAALKAGLPKG